MAGCLSVDGFQFSTRRARSYSWSAGKRSCPSRPARNLLIASGSISSCKVGLRSSRDFLITSPSRQRCYQTPPTYLDHLPLVALSVSNALPRRAGCSTILLVCFLQPIEHLRVHILGCR